MYEYIIGTIVKVTPRYIVVESGQMGYLVFVANPFRYQVDLDRQQKIYLHQAVRETEIMLYGFVDEIIECFGDRTEKCASDLSQ